MKHLHSVQMKKTKQYIFSSEEDGEMRVYYLHAKNVTILPARPTLKCW
jgi:hypothetical protein